MKSIVMKNKLNGEQVICPNLKEVNVIEGVEYLLVNRLGSERKFLMRKDALEKVPAERRGSKA